MYSLKPGADREEFENWSRDVDQKAIARQPCVNRFEVYRMEGGFEDEQPYDYVEDVDVTSWEDWMKMAELDEIKDLAEPFARMIDAERMVMIYGQKL